MTRIIKLRFILRPVFVVDQACGNRNLKVHDLSLDIDQKFERTLVNDLSKIIAFLTLVTHHFILTNVFEFSQVYSISLSIFVQHITFMPPFLLTITSAPDFYLTGHKLSFSEALLIFEPYLKSGNLNRHTNVLSKSETCAVHTRYFWFTLRLVCYILTSFSRTRFEFSHQ